MDFSTNREHRINGSQFVWRRHDSNSRTKGQDVDASVTRGSINRGTWKGGVMYYKIDRGLSKSRILLNIGLNVYRSHRDDFNTFARHVLLVRLALRMSKQAYLSSVSVCPCYQVEFLNSWWIFKSPMTDNHHAEKADYYDVSPTCKRPYVDRMIWHCAVALWKHWLLKSYRTKDDDKEERNFDMHGFSVINTLIVAQGLWKIKKLS